MAPGKRPIWQRVIGAVMLVVAVLAGGAMLAGRLGDVWWFFDLFAPFQMQYTIALIVAALGLAAARLRRAAGVVAIVAVIGVARIAPLYIAPAGQASESVESITLMHFNVGIENHRFNDIIAALDASGADLVTIQELSTGLDRAITRRSQRYRPLLTQPRDHAFGQGVYIRRSGRLNEAIESAEATHIPPARNVPVTEVTLDLDGKRLTLLAVHTFAPVTPKMHRLRETMMRQLGQRAAVARADGESLIIVGDMNATPWCSAYRQMMRPGGLVDSQRGFGYQPTWTFPGTFIGKPLTIPIDHCLHTPDLTTVSRGVGPSLGSDHRAILVTLAWPGDDK